MKSKFILGIAGLLVTTLGFSGPVMIGVGIKNNTNTGLNRVSYAPQGCFTAAPAQFLQRSGYQDSTKYYIYYSPNSPQCPHTPAQVVYQSSDGTRSITLAVNTLDQNGNPACWYNLTKSGFSGSTVKNEQYQEVCGFLLNIND
jgi:hypothetical protein